MAGRFQRLDNSQDIATPLESSYQSGYYDEPQSMYAADTQRRNTSTTRKPVPISSPPLPYSQVSQQNELFLESQFNTPRLSDKSTPQSENQNPFNNSKRPSRVSLVKTVSRVWSGVRGQHVSHVATPLWAAPWRHQPCPDLGGAKVSTVREFSRVKQRNRIFFHFFIQWLVPVAFCAAIAVAFRVYSAKTIITRQEKYVFNALVLGLSLCLGFAVVNGMKEYMNILRWRLLARRFRSLQEFETLLGISSQKKALRLLWVGRTVGSIVPNGTQLLCFCYILLMLTMQVVIALLGLTQSIETSAEHVNLVKGNVSIIDLSYISQGETYESTGETGYVVQSGAANAYGITGQAFSYDIQSNISTDSDAQDIAYHLHTDNKTSWWYWFTDQCPEPSCPTYVLTSRYVQATAKCKMLTILNGGFNDARNVSYTDANNHRSWLQLPPNVASTTSTWMSNMDASCGPRCTSAFVVNVGWKNTATKKVVGYPQLFQCNNTISAVGGAEDNADYHKLPDEQARLIAGGIGYNGILDPDSTFQSRVYDGSSPWSWSRNGNKPQTEIEVANLMMRFSMGSVSAMDQLGPRLFVNGDSPQPAQKVEIKWFWAGLILVLVPAVQFLVLLVAVAWGNTAIVQDGSYLSTAALLRPVIERLEKTGCALTSDEICEALGNPEVAYGVREPHNQGSYGGGGMVYGSEHVKHLDLMFGTEEDGKAYDMSWQVGTKMPEGRYDGLKCE